jgi:cytochrome P450
VTLEVATKGRAFLTSDSARRSWKDLYVASYESPPVEVFPGHWLVSGYDDVVDLMRSPLSGMSAPFPVTVAPHVNDLFLSMLPYEPPDEHHRLRALTAAAFTPDALERVESVVRVAVVDELFPAVFGDDGCDIVGGLGTRLPLVVSCSLLDIDPTDWDEVGQWASTLYSQIGRYGQSDAELAHAERALESFESFVWRWASGDRTIVGGLGDRLVALWKGGDLTAENLLAYVALFLFTGRDTLTHATANAIWMLGQSPEIFQVLRRDPSASRRAFDEAMRLWGPIRLCVRQLTGEVRRPDYVMEEGALLFLMIHAANRDPRRFERPDDFRWDRRNPARLAFGVGAHGCLGAAAGTMVGQTLFRVLAERCSHLQSSPSESRMDYVGSLPILGIQDVRLSAIEAPERSPRHAR